MPNVFLDWSGVIADIAPVMLCVVNHVLEKNGAREIDTEELRREWEEPYMNFYRKYLPGLTIEQENICFSEARLACPMPKPYEGIVAVLRDLKNRGFTLAVVSTEPEEVLQKELMSFELKGVMNKVHYVEHDKSIALPNIIKKYPGAKNVFVGDAENDIVAGKKAGITTIATVWGLHSEEKLETCQPDFLVHTAEELKRVLIEKI